MRKQKSMTLAVFAEQLDRELLAIDEERLAEELAPVLPAAELAGLLPRMRAGVRRVVEWLAGES